MVKSLFEFLYPNFRTAQMALKGQFVAVESIAAILAGIAIFA